MGTCNVHYTLQGVRRGNFLSPQSRIYYTSDYRNTIVIEASWIPVDIPSTITNRGEKCPQRASFLNHFALWEYTLAWRRNFVTHRLDEAVREAPRGVGVAAGLAALRLRSRVAGPLVPHGLLALR